MKRWFLILIMMIVLFLTTNTVVLYEAIAKSNQSFLKLSFSFKLNPNEMQGNLSPMFINRDKQILMSVKVAEKQQVIRIYDALNGKIIKEQKVKDINSYFQVSPDLKWIYEVNYNTAIKFMGPVTVYNTATLQPVITIDSAGLPEYLVIPPNGKGVYLLSVREFETKFSRFKIRYWQEGMDEAAEYAEYDYFDRLPLWYSFKIWPDGERASFTIFGGAVGTTWGSRLVVFNLKTGKVLHTFKDTGGIYNFIESRNMILVNSLYPTAYDMTTYKKIATYKTPPIRKGGTSFGGLSNIQITSDSKYMINSYGDGKIRKWDLNTGKIISTLAVSSDNVSHDLFRDENTMTVEGSYTYSKSLIWRYSIRKQLMEFPKINAFKVFWARTNRVLLTGEGWVNGSTYSVWKLDQLLKDTEVIIDTYVDGIKKTGSFPPTIQNNKAFVSISDLSRYIGGKKVASKSNKDILVTIQTIDHKIVVQEKNGQIKVNDLPRTLLEQPRAINGELYVSVDDVKTIFGIQAEYDTRTKSVYLTIEN
ncbi:stalk domain-containing protein [Cohnella soli]|uniref:Stalk domain-containing protein n=1 Tax=Cohnella soli TaxID=425005 RepID=A0ABW0HMS7_9BACL